MLNRQQLNKVVSHVFPSDLAHCKQSGLCCLIRQNLQTAAVLGAVQQQY